MARRSLAFRLLPSFVILVGLATSSGTARVSLGATDPSLTIVTQECPEPLPLDGTPISLETCPTSDDRTFKLTGPEGQEVELTSRLQFVVGGTSVRSVEWTVNSRDDLEDSGEYTLTEQDGDPANRTLYECLKAIDGDLVPAKLALVAGGVKFDWTPAGSTSDDIEGEALTCSAISRPVDPDLPATGIVRIHAVVVGPEDRSDLVVRAAGDEPFDLRAGVETDVPASTYTLADDTGAAIVLAAPEADEGVAVVSFAVPTGDYTLTADATGASQPVTVESGQTVLGFASIGEEIDPPVTDPLVLDLPDVETPSPDDDAPESTDTAPQINAVDTFSFSAYDWAGAYPYVNTSVYGRECVAVYGAGSSNATATLTFNLDRVTIGTSRLVFTGLDDEMAGRNPIVVTVNGAVIYSSGSPFENWNPSDPAIPWTEVAVPFGNEMLVEGANQIVVTNNAPGGSVGLPPYILLSEARVEVGSTVDAP